MTTVLSPVVDSSWNAIRFLVVALLIVAAASLAFMVGRTTVSNPARTISVQASAPDFCRGAHHGAC